MNRFYTLAYAVGFTPWEKAGHAGGDELAAMFAREEVERGGPGSALDLGCGSGMHLVTLARRGWQVTGVDVINKALNQARKRIADNQVTATVVHADVTELPVDAVGSGYDFFLDLGCFHGLNQAQRTAMAAAVTARAKADATLLMFAFTKPVGPPFMPQGATHADIEAAYDAWDVVDVVTPTIKPAMPKIARNSGPTFYRLRRRG
jgi:SAM-dependent methyltransferase